MKIIQEMQAWYEILPGFADVRKPSVMVGLGAGVIFGVRTFCDFGFVGSKGLRLYCIERNGNEERSIRPFVILISIRALFSDRERFNFGITFLVTYVLTCIVMSELVQYFGSESCVM